MVRRRPECSAPWRARWRVPRACAGQWRGASVAEWQGRVRRQRRVPLRHGRAPHQHQAPYGLDQRPRPPTRSARRVDRLGPGRRARPLRARDRSSHQIRSSLQRAHFHALVGRSHSGATSACSSLRRLARGAPPSRHAQCAYRCHGALRSRRDIGSEGARGAPSGHHLSVRRRGRAGAHVRQGALRACGCECARRSSQNLGRSAPAALISANAAKARAAF